MADEDLIAKKCVGKKINYYMLSVRKGYVKGGMGNC